MSTTSEQNGGSATPQAEVTSTTVSLPAPTGPYKVGRVSYDWVDTTRDERYSQNKGEKRELMVWVWYPAAPRPDAQVGVYMPAGWDAVGQVWGFDTDHVRIHSFPDAPVVADEARNPVLVFSPSGFPPYMLSAILEEVASHGYIVAGINHTYDTTVTIFSDGRVVPVNAAAMGEMGLFGPTTVPYQEQFRLRAAYVDYKTADIRSVIDQLERLNTGTDPLAGRLDLARLGTFGHSFGGNAALECCRIDSRCRAGANLDGANWNAVGKIGLSKSAMLIASEHLEYLQPCESLVKATGFGSVEHCETEKAILLDGWQKVYNTAQPGYGVTVKGARHTNFMDVPFLPLHEQSMFKPMVASATIGSERMWRITCDYLLAFFDKHLNNSDEPLLDGPSPAYPEILFGEPDALYREHKS